MEFNYAYLSKPQITLYLRLCDCCIGIIKQQLENGTLFEGYYLAKMPRIYFDSLRSGNESSFSAECLCGNAKNTISIDTYKGKIKDLSKGHDFSTIIATFTVTNNERRFLLHEILIT